jgi:hypothetical protein
MSQFIVISFVGMNAIALDPHAVAHAQAIEARLRHRLRASVVESNANEIEILRPVRFADFLIRTLHLPLHVLCRVLNRLAAALDVLARAGYGIAARQGA